MSNTLQSEQFSGARSIVWAADRHLDDLRETGWRLRGHAEAEHISMVKVGLYPALEASFSDIVKTLHVYLPETPLGLDTQKFGSDPSMSVERFVKGAADVGFEALFITSLLGGKKLGECVRQAQAAGLRPIVACDPKNEGVLIGHDGWLDNTMRRDVLRMSPDLGVTDFLVNTTDIVKSIQILDNGHGVGNYTLMVPGLDRAAPRLLQKPRLASVNMSAIIGEAITGADSPGDSIAASMGRICLEAA